MTAPQGDIFRRLRYVGVDIEPDGDGTWALTDPWLQDQPTRQHQSVDDLERWLDRHENPAPTKSDRSAEYYHMERAISAILFLAPQRGIEHADPKDVRKRVAAVWEEKQDEGLPAVVEHVLTQLERELGASA